MISTNDLDEKSKQEIHAGNNSEPLIDKNKYDIFISYRREGGEFFVKELCDTLTAKGYRVFRDIESMKSGPFDRQLLGIIERCTDFIVVCSKGSMIRCENEGDWVRTEIAHALKHKKNVVPVLLRGFSWNEVPLPEDIAPLSQYAGVEAHADATYNATIDNLANQYLKSKPRKSRKGLIAIFAAVAVLLAGFITFLSLNNTDLPVVGDLIGGGTVETIAAGDAVFSVPPSAMEISSSVQPLWENADSDYRMLMPSPIVTIGQSILFSNENGIFICKDSGQELRRLSSDAHVLFQVTDKLGYFIKDGSICTVNENGYIYDPKEVTNKVKTMQVSDSYILCQTYENETGLYKLGFTDRIEDGTLILNDHKILSFVIDRDNPGVMFFVKRSENSSSFEIYRYDIELDNCVAFASDVSAEVSLVSANDGYLYLSDKKSDELYRLNKSNGSGLVDCHIKTTWDYSYFYMDTVTMMGSYAKTLGLIDLPEAISSKPTLNPLVVFEDNPGAVIEQYAMVDSRYCYIIWKENSSRFLSVLALDDNTSSGEPRFTTVCNVSY